MEKILKKNARRDLLPFEVCKKLATWKAGRVIRALKEKCLKLGPGAAFNWALYFAEGVRDPEIEACILDHKNWDYLIDYVINCLHKPWPEAEPIIRETCSTFYIYQYLVYAYALYGKEGPKELVDRLKETYGSTYFKNYLRELKLERGKDVH